MADAMLSPDQYARVRDIFDRALAVPEGAARDTFVTTTCADDPVVHAEVVSLLAALDRSVDVWQDAVPAMVAHELRQVTARWARPAPTRVGTRVGAYELARLVGEGGMGAVFEGVRIDAAFEKRVAVKFLRRADAGELAQRRFRHERQILASLQHPNIAALFDGGVSEDGQLYLVMEFVDGTPITQYADARRLDLRARLGLLRQVCAAVQHAHTQLVVHRDLKPGNILVTGDGQVKLLDFGIARLLRDDQRDDAAPLTVDGSVAFTPEYASPEQVRGITVGTASDVYALGVVAYELLVGRRPYEVRGALLSEIQTTICTTPPPTPSGHVPPDLDGAARRRRQLVGDLDAILLQALRKEPERRYRSVAEFADELQRVLDGVPVRARRDAFGYRFGKFVRRRKFEVAAGVLLVVSLMGGIVSTSRAAARAEQERTVAEEANRFLSVMLAAADPGYQGRDVTVREMLAQAARDIADDSLPPAVEAQVRHTLGQTYYELGLPDSASEHVERAVQLRTQLYGEVDMRTSMSLSYLAAIAEQRGNWQRADSISQRILRIQQQLRPRDEGELATTYDNVARYVFNLGLLDSALALQRAGLTHRRRATDSASLDALPYTLVNLAVSYMNRDDYREAQRYAAEALAAEARVHGTESAMYGSVLRLYSQVYEGLGHADSADAMIRTAVSLLERVLGTEHPDYWRAMGVYAQHRLAARDWPTAERIAQQVVDVIGTHLPASNMYAAASLQNLGLARIAQGDTARGGDALERALALRREVLPEGHWLIAASESVVGHHYAMTGRWRQGEPMLRRAVAALEASRGADASPTREAAGRLAEALTRFGSADEAARWRLQATRDSSP